MSIMGRIGKPPKPPKIKFPKRPKTQKVPKIVLNSSPGQRAIEKVQRKHQKQLDQDQNLKKKKGQVNTIRTEFTN